MEPWLYMQVCARVIYTEI